MTKETLLPPIDVLPTKAHHKASTTLVPARTEPGDGFFESAKSRAERDAESFGALTLRTQSEAGLFDAERELIDVYARRQRALAALHELPEILASERERRRAERAEELRQAQHRYETKEVGRMAELAQAEAVLVEAKQALRAQREYGYTTFQLAWKKKYCEMLDVELGAAERLAILRQHDKGLAQAFTAPPSLRVDAQDAEIDETLHARRSELAASGLDTGRIDSLLERRRSRK